MWTCLQTYIISPWTPWQRIFFQHFIIMCLIKIFCCNGTKSLSSPPQNLPLNQFSIIPILILTTYFFKIHFNITLPSTVPMSPKWLLAKMFSTKILYVFPPLCMLHMLPISNFKNCPINITWIMQIMKHLKSLILSNHCFISLRSK